MVKMVLCVKPVKKDQKNVWSSKEAGDSGCSGLNKRGQKGKKETIVLEAEKEGSRSVLRKKGCAAESAGTIATFEASLAERKETVESAGQRRYASPEGPYGRGSSKKG